MDAQPIAFFGQEADLQGAFESLTHSEHVPIGMTDMHLANIPRHIRGLEYDLDSIACAMPGNRVDVVYPERNPAA